MMQRMIRLAMVLVLLVPALALAGGKQEPPAEAKAAGPAAQTPGAAAQSPAAEAPAAEDWTAIYEAARGEGKVVIWSHSSRIFDGVKGFKEKYPGVEVEAFDITGTDQVEKLTREQGAGLFNVDVLMLANGPTLINELLPQGAIRNYVPEVLLDGKKSGEVIPARFREPLLVHSLEAKVVFYNFETYPKPPIDSLWDLTRPEWKGKVQMKDPMLTEENLNLLQTIVQKAGDMAAAYQKEFGRPIELGPGIPDAGYEFIRRLVRNDLVLVTSDGTASKAVGTAGQSDPPLTFAVASSKIRDNEKGQKLAIAWDLSPMAGLTKENYLVMAGKAPHPNAARLLIRWLIGDARGGAGMEPWNVPGQWTARQDVPSQGDVAQEDLARYTWYIDYPYVYREGLAVRDFWMGQ